MSVVDARQTRMVQREISKRCIDISTLDIHVQHGVVYLRGTARKLRGHDIDIAHELQIISHILRAMPEIRDVVNEVVVRD